MSFDLIQGVQKIFTSDRISEASSLLGEPAESVGRTIDHAIPAVSGAMTEVAQTEGGARRLYETARDGAGLIGPGGRMDLSSVLEQGPAMIKSLFGDHGPEMVSGLSDRAGVPSSLASRVLGMVTPIAMSVLGKELLSRGAGIGSLAKLLPGRGPSVVTEPRAATTMPPRKSSWWAIPLVALAAVLAILVLQQRQRRHRLPAREPSAKVVPPSAGTPAPLGDDASVLTQTLEDRAAPLPRRFVLEPAGATPAASTKALDEVATVLAAHPTANVEIDGASTGAAETVRGLLVQRGVDANRITTRAGVHAPNRVELVLLNR
jgi:hypothetical protein